MPETTLWQGRSSQLTNIGTYLFCAVFAAAVVAAALIWGVPWIYLLLVLPVLLAVRAYLRPLSQRYTLTNERLRIESGLISQRVDDLELYRVKDLTLVKPAALRMFGLGTLVLHTSDYTTPQLMIRAITEPERVHDLLRANVEQQRSRKRVSEVDFNREDQLAGGAP
jgi:uncharacterized membrane protein YdbT with pleckstrin-like domain